MLIILPLILTSSPTKTAVQFYAGCKMNQELAIIARRQKKLKFGIAGKNVYGKINTRIVRHRC